MIPYELKVLSDKVRGDIGENGMNQADVRLSRRTRYLLGYSLTVDDGNLVRWLKKEKPAKKFEADWDRMSMWFECAAMVAKLDPDSRRLLIVNLPLKFVEVEQCFTQFHFVKDHSFDSNEYVLIVTQRSGDMLKFTDDLIFFGSICRKWELALKTKVRKIIIHYGHIHHEA